MRKLFACIWFIAVTSPAMACSTFFVGTSSSNAILGRNTDDGNGGTPGILVVNKRGVSKKAIPWAVWGPASGDTKPAEWVSRFGSVTFTAMGRELPDGGMNEAGLVIEEMSLGGTSYPQHPDSSSIVHMQWIQYQLDNHSSVDEAIANLNTLSIKGWKWHFLLGDNRGQCAAVDFIDGEILIARGDTRSGCVLTNDQHKKSVAHLETFTGFGGTAAIPSDLSSLSRFVRASAALDTIRTSEAAGHIAEGFSMLERVAAPGGVTFRSIIYDFSDMRIYFRSFNSPSIKSLSLAKLDFSPESPVLAIDIDSKASGDVSNKLAPYSRSENSRVVNGLISLLRRSPTPREQMDSELARRGVTLENWTDYLASYPEAPTNVMLPGSLP